MRQLITQRSLVQIQPQVEEATGKHVRFHLYTNVDFTKLDELARKNGMIPSLAGRRRDDSGS